MSRLGQRVEPVHGTYAGAQWHYRTGTPMCSKCKLARNEYMKQWRTTKTGKRRSRIEQQVQHGAIAELIGRHGDEYRELLDQWRAAVQS